MSQPEEPAFAAAIPSGGWMPIETAPKDGTPILVWAPNWNGRGPIVYTKFQGFWWNEFMNGGMGANFKPKWWMLMPEPPPASCDGSAEGGETRSGSTEGNSAVGLQAETPPPSPQPSPQITREGEPPSPTIQTEGGEP